MRFLPDLRPDSIGRARDRIRDPMFPTLVVVYSAQRYQETCWSKSIDHRNNYIPPAIVVSRLFGTLAHRRTQRVIQPDLG